jgi:hypothetical protein
MKNAKTRFGLDDDGSIFDYATSKNLPANGVYATENGTCYDLEVLAHLLGKVEFIDEAIVGRVPATGESHRVFGDDVTSELTVREGVDPAAATTERIEQIAKENSELKAHVVDLTDSNRYHVDEIAQLRTMVSSRDEQIEALLRQNKALATQPSDAEVAERGAIPVDASGKVIDESSGQPNNGGDAQPS